MVDIKRPEEHSNLSRAHRCLPSTEITGNCRLTVHTCLSVLEVGYVYTFNMKSRTAWSSLRIRVGRLFLMPLVLHLGCEIAKLFQVQPLSVDVYPPLDTYQLRFLFMHMFEDLKLLPKAALCCSLLCLLLRCFSSLRSIARWLA